MKRSSIHENLNKGALALALLLLIKLTGCNGRSNEGEVAEWQLEFRVAGENNQIGYPIAIKFVNDTLLVNDFYGDSLVHCIDVNSWKTNRKFARKGNGPGEVIPPVECIAYGDSLMIFSRPTMTLFKAEGGDYDRLTSTATFPTVVSRLYKAGENEFIASMIPYNSSDFDGKRFIVLNEEGTVQYAFGEYPRFWTEEKEIPVDVLANFHQVDDFCKISPDTFAVVSSHVLSIYAKNNLHQYELVKEKLLFPYEYTYNLSNGMISAKTRLKEGFPMGADGIELLGEDIIVAYNMNQLPDFDLNVEFLRYDKDLNLKAIYHPSVPVKAPFLIDKNRSIIAFDNEKDGTFVVSDPLK